MPNEQAPQFNCLALTFPDEAARRAHFTARLAERLRDPAFRAQPGFPNASDADILRLSDPPWFTACPNPFLGEFAPTDPAPATYQRDPFAVDVREGKTDPLYKAHGYHTKVPHLAILPSILHYTRPGDVVLDGFCGSGMTGVAAQMCETASARYRAELEARWRAEGREAPAWGARKVVLNDLGPAATFIAANYNTPFDVPGFSDAAARLLLEVDAEIGWMYETLHTDGVTRGRIEYTVWSEVFACPECSGEVVFLDEALAEDGRTRDTFPCPHCAVDLDKDKLDRSMEADVDPATGQPWQHIRLRPARLRYRAGGAVFEKELDDADLALIERVRRAPFPAEAPTVAFPIEAMYHGSRLAPKGFTHVHHLFFPRAARALAALWRRANAETDTRMRNALLFFVEQAIWGMSVLARYAPTHYSQVNQYLNGVYYVGSQIVEVSPWYILEGKRSRLVSAFRPLPSVAGGAMISTGTCAAIPLPDASVDYVFTDPPFGENIYYADLNFLVEAWHRILTDPGPEAIVDQAKKKTLHRYQELMRDCFREYGRVLKPGRWMTVVFSNSSTAVWRAIQEALGTAGFVVADVRNLHKTQLSYRQQTSSAVKQDLVISAYKPTAALVRTFALEPGSESAVWAFVREHLGSVPRFEVAEGKSVVVAERTRQVLHDRMIAFHVQRGIALPMSGAEFFAGLEARFVKRGEMFFRSDQVAEYDAHRIATPDTAQVPMFVNDEATAIQWIRRELDEEPRTFAALNPAFMRESMPWPKREKGVELKEMLEQNFLRYDGAGLVPEQIVRRLAPSLRALGREHASVHAAALGCWYVPDPASAIDLARLRERALLVEFAEYRASRERRLREFRTEAVRVGFHAAFQANDYQAILDVGNKLPEQVIQEDPDLLVYYDAATTLLEA